MDDVDRTTERLLAEQLEREALRRTAASRPAHTGPCVDCDEDIDPRRQRAQPHATRCADCETRVERRAKQYRRPH
jgi:RNA polymerase-binding transcription factor DksA